MNDFIEDFVAERDAALRSLDPERIAAYCHHWHIPWSGTETQWAGVHKAITALTSATDKEKARSASWLIDHGYLPYISSAVSWPRSRQ